MSGSESVSLPSPRIVATGALGFLIFGAGAASALELTQKHARSTLPHILPDEFAVLRGALSRFRAAGRVEAHEA